MTIPGATTLDDAVISIDPLALPPVRRQMIFLMLALAALLHVVTNGWGPIENGRDGLNAAMARELALGMEPAEISHLWGEKVQPGPEQWLTAQSFQFFGINEFAARFPLGVASVLVVWLVFLTAERLGGMWRGLASGIVAATTSGAILHGRDGGGATLTAAAMFFGLYAAIQMLEQNSKIRWHWLFWLAIAFLLFSRQAIAATILVGCVALSTCYFRESRIRLRLPWFIVALVSFLTVLATAFSTGFLAAPGWHFPTNAAAMKLLWMLFPWSILLLPPCLLRIGKVVRLRDSSPGEILLWNVSLGCLLWALLTPPEVLWPESIACLWPLFAALAGLIWERVTSGQRILGIALLIVLSLGGMTFCGRVAGKEWLILLQPIWWLSCSVIVVFGISAIISVMLRHSRAALITLAASIVPLAFNLLDARVRYNWAETMKDLGRRVEVSYQPASRIFVSEELKDVSSFLFYAPHGLQIQNIQSLKNTKPLAADFIFWKRQSGPPAPDLNSIGSNRSHVLSVVPTR